MLLGPSYRSHPDKVWSTDKLTPLYLIHPHLYTDAGDLFPLAWSPTHSTIYIGCQNTSIQWYDFTNVSDATLSGTSTPRPLHKFFNSYRQTQRRLPDLEAINTDGHTNGVIHPAPLAELNVPSRNVIDSAHHGYVYCMALLPSTWWGATTLNPQDVCLITGSGDETMKVRLFESITHPHDVVVTGLEMLAHGTATPEYY